MMMRFHFRISRSLGLGKSFGQGEVLAYSGGDDSLVLDTVLALFNPPNHPVRRMVSSVFTI